MHEIYETAWAKINLSLRVLGRRDDGYHELSSLVVFADYGDRLTLTPGPGFSLTISGPFAKRIDGDNLVEIVATSLLGSQLDGDMPDGGRGACDFGKIHLEKLLPVAAGLGGGSADAAALLRLMERVGLCRLDHEFTAQLGRRYGADVPVCTAAMPAVMSGIGEALAPVAHFPAIGVLMVNPGIALSTGAVFKQLAAGDFDGAAAADFCARQADRGAQGFHSLDEVVAYMQAAPNDLTDAAVALSPDTGSVLTQLARLPGCHIARLSGSGSTCFGLFETATAAAEAAGVFRQRHPYWWVMPAAIRHV